MRFIENSYVESMPNYSVAMPLDPKKRILLQRKDEGHPFWPNYWCTFGGKVEEGESREEALARELREETRLNLDSVRHFKSQIFTETALIGQNKGQQREVAIHYFGAEFDGNLKSIKFGEGAGFSIFERQELERYGKFGLIVPPNYEAIKAFYDSFKE